MAIQQFLILERIVYLCIRHGTGIEPNVNQVRFAFHRLAVDVYKRQLQHIIVGNETHFIDSVLPVILRCILVVLPVGSQVQRQIYQIRITDGICGIGYVLFV